MPLRQAPACPQSCLCRRLWQGPEAPERSFFLEYIHRDLLHWKNGTDITLELVDAAEKKVWPDGLRFQVRGGAAALRWWEAGRVAVGGRWLQRGGGRRSGMLWGPLAAAAAGRRGRGPPACRHELGRMGGSCRSGPQQAQAQRVAGHPGPACCSDASADCGWKALCEAPLPGHQGLLPCRGANTEPRLGANTEPRLCVKRALAAGRPPGAPAKPWRCQLALVSGRWLHGGQESMAESRGRLLPLLPALPQYGRGWVSGKGRLPYIILALMDTLRAFPGGREGRLAGDWQARWPTGKRRPCLKAGPVCKQGVMCSCWQGSWALVLEWGQGACRWWHGTLTWQQRVRHGGRGKFRLPPPQPVKTPGPRCPRSAGAVPDIDAVVAATDSPLFKRSDGAGAAPMFCYNSHAEATDIPFPGWLVGGLVGLRLPQRGACPAPAPASPPPSHAPAARLA